MSRGEHSDSTRGMPRQIIEFTTDKRFVRRARGLKTIKAMVEMYCRGHVHSDGMPLCAECEALLEYARRRLERCVFGDAKPACSNCVVHCYRADMREKIRVVMRWAGPRMLLRHPYLAVCHILEERRPVPTLPAKSEKGRGHKFLKPWVEADEGASHAVHPDVRRQA